MPCRFRGYAVGAMEREIIDLYELQGDIRSGLEDMFPDRVWVRAEIASVSVKSNGHCYLELSQSGPSGIVAKAHAVIWRSRYGVLGRAFEQMTGSSLQAGMSVLVRVQVSYSELYGLTLSIDDLDAEATVGLAEKRRRETVARLEKEGLMMLQQGLQVPQLPYRLAVISAATAAGYGDFCRHLEGNEYGFRFDVRLFEATMQGAGAPDSIVAALERAAAQEDKPDAVLILRGGGSGLDLACFDEYQLCRAVATCPIPVFTAIGHDRDFHVADMVAHTFVKTPTALADEFLDCYMAEDERISSYVTRLKLAFSAKVSAMESRVALLQSRIHAADPRSVLARGYALVTDSTGVVLKKASDVGAGDGIEVIFSDGKLKAVVNEKV